MDAPDLEIRGVNEESAQFTPKQSHIIKKLATLAETLSPGESDAFR